MELVPSKKSKQILAELSKSLAQDVADFRDKLGNEDSIKIEDVLDLFELIVIELNVIQDIITTSSVSSINKNINNYQSNNQKNNIINIDSSKKSNNRRIGVKLDYFIINYAINNSPIFSLDEIFNALKSADYDVPKASLSTKLSRLTDVSVLKRVFRGAYSRGDKAIDELKRIENWLQL